nr:MAG TPA: hypothetical protein [Caudoviricetes sp.]
MDLNTAKKVIGDTSLSDDEVSVLLLKAKKLARNQHFWKPDDNPTDEQLENFYDRYEFEIYDIAKSVQQYDARGGLTEFSELGVTRRWGKTGTESINASVASIPPKTYIE